MAYNDLWEFSSTKYPDILHKDKSDKFKKLIFSKYIDDCNHAYLFNLYLHN